MARCYSQLTGERLPRDSSYRKTPPATSAAALAVCDSFLESSVLDPASNKVKNLSSNQMGLKVLNTLYDFHRSWFGADTFTGMQGSNYRHIQGTTDNFDSTEAALFLTRAVVAPSGSAYEPYSSILQGKVGAYALRQVDSEVNSTKKYPSNLLPSRYVDMVPAYQPMILVKKDGATFRRSDASTTTLVTVSHPIQIGDLIGIAPDQRSLILTNYNPYTERHNPDFSATRLNAQSAVSDPNYMTGFNLYENQGGGILGLNSFIFMHWGQDPGVLQSGSLKMGRRWTEKVFNSLFCRELPVLRISDVGGYVAPGAVSDFRKSTSCVSCHATMDQMAAVGRNILISASDSDYSAAAPGKFTHVIGRLKVSKSIGDLWPAMDQSDYHLTSPSGKVMYRTSDGALVNRSVASFEEVGATLRSSPDLFKCATNRYFELLTGIHLNLYDKGDPALATTVQSESAETKEIRAYLDAVSSSFSQHQNLRTMIKALMRSKYFQDSNFTPKD